MAVLISMVNTSMVIIMALNADIRNNVNNKSCTASTELYMITVMMILMIMVIAVTVHKDNRSTMIMMMTATVMMYDNNQ